MSQSKNYHTQSGLTACGGVDRDTQRSCIKFEAGACGAWKTLKDNLVEDRRLHSSWVNSDGDILLIGGRRPGIGERDPYIYSGVT